MFSVMEWRKTVNGFWMPLSSICVMITAAQLEMGTRMHMLLAIVWMM